MNFSQMIPMTLLELFFFKKRLRTYCIIYKQKCHILHSRSMASKKSPVSSAASAATTKDSIAVPVSVCIESKKLIAVCQLTSKKDKEKNLQICSQLIEAAKEMNCLMAFLPEACDYISDTSEESVAMAEPLDGKTMQAYCKMAKNNHIWISVGGFHEKTHTDKVQNAHVIINSDGKIVSVYRKTHLFDVDVADKRMKESDYILRGEEIIPPVETPVGNLGMSICYDIRFPELSLTLAKLNAHILTFPSAFTFQTGAAHWETLLKARAIDTQCYVVAAAQYGIHNKSRYSWGHSMVVDPRGTIIAQCTNGTNISVAEINFEKIEEVQGATPLWKNRREDLYGSLVLKGPMAQSHAFLFCCELVHENRVIHATKHSVAFMSSCPIVPGHLLVVPRHKVSRLSELTAEESSDLFLLIQVMDKALEKWPIIASTVFMKEGVEHLHVHVVPRRPHDFPSKDDVYTFLERHDEISEKPITSARQTAIRDEVAYLATKMKNLLKKL